MYFSKYIKYLVKNKLNGGHPKDDINLLEPITQEKNLTQSTDKCNDIEKYDISSIGSIVLEEKNYRELKRNNTPTGGTGVMYFKEIGINGKIFLAKTVIGQGSSGMIVLYINEEPGNRTKYGIVIKYGRIGDDAKILNYIKSRNICPTAYVNSLFHTFQHNNERHGFIIMEYMDGTLEDYLRNNRNMSYDVIKKIFADLAAQFYCFSRYGLMYTDIKLPNILYKCNKNDKDNFIDFTLGDLGGITNTNVNNEGVATFPPPERCVENSCGVFLNPDEKDVVWSLGILIMTIIGYNTLKYSYESFLGLKKDNDVESLINDSLAEAKMILSSKIASVLRSEAQSQNSAPAAVSEDQNSPVMSSGLDYFMDILDGMLKVNRDERITLREVYAKTRVIV